MGNLPGISNLAKRDCSMVASEEIAASGHMEFEMTRAKPD
jgi:hypothetical protein